MQKYSVAEIVQKFGYPESKIRRRIKKGLLPVIKEKEGCQEVLKVLVESEENLRAVVESQESHQLYYEETDGRFGECQDVQDVEYTKGLGESRIMNEAMVYEIFSQIQKQNISLVEDMKNYAQLAGQTKLLTDSENKTKEQYFQVIQENATLKARLELNQEKINELEEKLKAHEEKNKPASWLSKL